MFYINMHVMVSQITGKSSQAYSAGAVVSGVLPSNL